MKMQAAEHIMYAAMRLPALLFFASAAKKSSKRKCQLSLRFIGGQLYI
jgi:hypothetical protein